MNGFGAGAGWEWGGTRPPEAVYHGRSVVVWPCGDSAIDWPLVLARALGRVRRTCLVRHRPGLALPQAPEGLWGEFRANGPSSALVFQGYPWLGHQKQLASEAELVVVDGRVEDGSPVVVVLDESGQGWEAVPTSLRGRVVGCLGGRPSRVPPGGCPWFGAQDLEALAEILFDHWEGGLRRRAVVGWVHSSAGPHQAHQPMGARVADWAAMWFSDSGMGDHLPPGAQVLASGHPAWGDLGELLTLWDRLPKAAILAIQPGVDEGRIAPLFQARSPWSCAVAWPQPDSHLPAQDAILYEPECRDHFLVALASGISCPRRAVVHGRLALVDSGS